MSVTKHPIRKGGKVANDQRETATVSGTQPIDWKKDVFEFTISADTTFSDINLPSGTDAKTITIYLTGDFIPVFPTAWEVEPGDPYDGTKENRIMVDCINGTSGSEKIKFNIKNLS